MEYPPFAPLLQYGTHYGEGGGLPSGDTRDSHGCDQADDQAISGTRYDRRDCRSHHNRRDHGIRCLVLGTARHETRDAKLESRASGFVTRDSGFGARDTQHETRDAGYESRVESDDYAYISRRCLGSIRGANKRRTQFCQAIYFCAFFSFVFNGLRGLRKIFVDKKLARCKYFSGDKNAGKRDTNP